MKILTSHDVWQPPHYRQNEFVKTYVKFAKSMYSGMLTHTDWRKYYQQQLSNILEYVKRKSPYYSHTLSTVTPDNFSLQNLTELPFTTKEIIRQQGDDMLSMDMTDGVIYYETTGTTGRPLKTPRSWLEGFASNYHFSVNMSHLVQHKFTTRRPIVGILGPTELHSLGDAIGDVMRNANISHVKFWPYSPKVGFERAAQLIPEIGINILFGTPAVILPIVREALKDPILYQAIRKTVKLVLTLGEVTSQAMRLNIASLFENAECTPGAYGGTELLVVSNSCGFNRMHFSRQNYIAEILDPDSLHPVAPGETGELVLTYLIPGIRPLIRYRTGDLVSLDTAPCPCGNPCETLINHGRTSDRITIGNHRLMASELEELIMYSAQGVFGYRMSISSPNNTDLLAIDLELLSHSVPQNISASRIKERIRERLGITSEIRFVEKLPPVVNTGGFLSWKSARVNDMRQAGDHERDLAENIAERWLNGETPFFGNA